MSQNLNMLQQFEADQLAAAATANAPAFAAGDTVRVQVKVKEGDRERTQAYEGVVIARKNAGLNSSFTVRKLSFGEGVERVFPLYSPVIDKIEVVRKGDVRRAKLYYLRGRTGKAARIKEKGRVIQADQAVAVAPVTAAPAVAEIAAAEAVSA